MTRSPAKAPAPGVVKPSAARKRASKSAATKPASPETPAARAKRGKAVRPVPAPSKLAEVAATLLESRRKNAQALVEAGKKSYAGIEAILKRRLGILRDTLAELRTVARVMKHAGARDSVAHLDELARGAIQLTLNSVRELSALATTMQKEALETLARRLQDDLAEFKQLRTRRARSQPQ